MASPPLSEVACILGAHHLTSNPSLERTATGYAARTLSPTNERQGVSPSAAVPDRLTFNHA